MSYTPSFKCAYCEKENPARLISGGDVAQYSYTPCDCKESRDAWERQHRAEIERRKVLRRRGKRR